MRSIVCHQNKTLHIINGESRPTTLSLAVPEHALAWSAARCSTAAPTPPRFIVHWTRLSALQLTAAMPLPKHRVAGLSAYNKCQTKNHPIGWFSVCDYRPK